MPTLRGIVWAFCLYLSVVISDIAHTGRTIPAPHFDHSLNTLFLAVLGPIFCAWLVVYFSFNTKDRAIQTVGIISAIAFAFGILFALHQFEYISIGIPHYLSSWSWFIATVLLGYRMDQILKSRNSKIEIPHA